MPVLKLEIGEQRKHVKKDGIGHQKKRYHAGRKHDQLHGYRRGKKLQRPLCCSKAKEKGTQKIGHADNKNQFSRAFNAKRQN